MSPRAAKTPFVAPALAAHSFDAAAGRTATTTIGGAPAGFDALVLAAVCGGMRDVLYVARDDASMARMADALAFFAPDLDRLEFPAWDCLPYDRASPQSDIAGRRIDTLIRLATDGPEERAGGRPADDAGGRIVLSTVSALLQRVPSRASFAAATFDLETGRSVDPAALTEFLDRHGYGAAQTVMEPGEYAVRGGIVDIFPTGAEAPLRLDFFGDELETVRAFDPASQRTLGEAGIDRVVLKPVSEVPLDEAAVSRFRSRYRVLFGTSGDDDPLYGAVSAGRRHVGMEHWLPLFHQRLETLLDYLPDAVIVLAHQAEEARDARFELIAEYYAARLEFSKPERTAADTVYHPIRPETLYLDVAEWDERLAGRALGQLSPFTPPDGTAGAIDAGGRPGRDFSDIRVRPDENVFDALRDHVAEQQRSGRRVVVAAFTEGSRQRLKGVLDEHEVGDVRPVEDWREAAALPESAIALVVAAMETGFAADGLALVTEQDILGDRLNRPAKRRIRAENFIAEASSLGEGDLIVHVDHGIGQFDGLHTIEVGDAPHDCLRLIYAGGDKLFLPVENIEMVSRYGSETAGAQLDRLGGAAWQARRARLKDRIREMADELIRVAAARALRPASRVTVNEGLFNEFCAGFPFVETDDQARAIADTMADLTEGRPTDRLICGDVGFGKTEVALRAAFATALEGKQVAVVVPTTLLSRQHHTVFAERFAGFPVRIEQLSRLVGAKRAKEAKRGMADGTVDIVIGTHALLAKDVRFRDLGLLVVDEEQHFGVAHKENLKKLKADVHVLTLSATPIPRTLQLALTGLREMSLIATPPVDRLAVRTYVLPYDPVVVREAILREQYRGGQTFYVCPRIADLARVEGQLRDLVPEAKIAVAHGRLAVRELEDTVSRFYDGAFDVLVSTNIIESGLDLPSVNTIVIHRADMFGLAQLYQLRGRVGRSKTRAYAYLTLPPRQKLSAAAEKRLEVMHSLDTLGAGFSLASHDLDIRGAGNLLGEEQSGHIREVGIELYQQMLEEAVAEARGLESGDGGEPDWSPQISIGMPVLIPEAYVSDLTVRMGLYRRIAWLNDPDEIDAFAAELIDRFGALPEEADNLLKTVGLKNLCRQAGVAKVEAGPNGAVVSFHNDDFANPAGLVAFLNQQQGTSKLRPDHKLVYRRSWDDADGRFEGVRTLVKKLAEIAAAP